MKTALVLCALSVFAFGCEDENPPPRAPIQGTDAPDPPGATSGADAQVVDRIANAACDREQSCGTIGPGGYFARRDDCLHAMHDKYEPQLSHSTCPAGLDKEALNRCLSAFQANECAQPGDSITRSAHCSVSELCMKTSP